MLTRRKMLRDVLGAGVALSLGRTGRSALERRSGCGPPAERKIIVFSKQLEWIEDYDALCGLVAEIGFDGLELTVRPGGHVLPERVEDDLPRAVAAAARAGVEVAMITTRITDPAAPDAHRILETAGALGIATYRMGGLGYDDAVPVEESLETYRALFAELADVNRQHGLYGVYQNHAGGTRVSASIWDLWYLLKDLDPAWIGCQYDTRHAQLEGGSWWPVGLRLLSPYVKTTVAKDFRWAEAGGGRVVQNCPIGEGVVDFEHHFALVKQLDVGGPISLHFPYPLFEGADAMGVQERARKTAAVMRQKGVLRLRSMLQRAGLA